MSAEDSLSSKILTNIHFIADIYNIVNVAAAKAIDASAIKNANGKITRPGISGDVNIVRAGIPNLNRYSANCKQAKNKNFRNNSNIDKCIKTNKYFIDYNKNDIMIVGGAALNIYDYLLKEYKHRRGIAAMENYIKKKTSDIDIVWWPSFTAATNNPTVPINNEIVVSSSDAIMTLLTNFRNNLDKELNKPENRKKLIKHITPFIKASDTTNNVKNVEKENNNNSIPLTFKLEWIPFYGIGVHKVEVEFIVNGQSVKIIDISIHDSGTSQKFDFDGKLITDLSPMQNDPVYCTPDTTKLNSIKTFDITFPDDSTLTVRVPSIYSFVQQQMFAFDNLIRESQTKGLINYKRVEFIKLLLKNWQNNNENYRYIIGQPITQELEYIEERQKASIEKLGNNILKVCKQVISLNSDEYIDNLCDKAAELFRKQILMELERIYNLFYDTYKETKKINTKDKMKMYDLKEQIEKIKRKYFEMPAKNLIALNMSEAISKEKEVADLMEQERVIRAKIIQNQRRVQMKTDEVRKAPEKVKIEEPKRATNRNEIFDFNSEYYTTTKDGKPQYITKSGIIWYYNNPQRKLGLWRLNPYTKEWEQPDRKDPSYGIIRPAAAAAPYTAPVHIVKPAILPPPPPPPPAAVGAVPLPPIAYSHRAPDGTLVYYTPEHIPWYIDPYGAVLMKYPTGYRVIGQMPPPPPPLPPPSFAAPSPVYQQQVGYFGPSPAFASTGSRRGGTSRTRKNKYRNNKTLKK